jgi:predicted Zn-dependent peptidase
MDSWRTLFTEMEALQRLTAADVQRVAQRYFIETNRIVGIARRGARTSESSAGGGR